MRINLEWLREYVTVEQPAPELAERLTLTSLESVPLLEQSEFFSAVTIGLVQEVTPHPNADKLAVCEVEAGESGTRQIICGAPNVAAGQKVPVILPGTTLPDGTEISSVKLRGVQSDGMIPSERELGLSDSHAGIMVLREEAEIGQSLWHYLEEYWQGLDVEITPNRPDGMSHLGVAREFAALFDTPLRKPNITVAEKNESVEKQATLRIHEPEKCPRYAARVITNVRIGPSPKWMQERLAAIGLRPINNVVDASNYVLMETGHPLHTFDLDRLADHTIEVRSAKAGEQFTTLDGKKRELDDRILLICDAEKPVAIAGIMGGENSEVTDDTVNLLIESAYFDPTTIRRGSKYLGLSTEASKRFERGADPEGVLYALNRITALIQELAGGEVSAGVLDVYPEPIQPPEISIRTERTRQILGVEVSQEEIARVLQGIECEILRRETDTITVRVPTFRPDLEREIDLIEEVLRFHGMETIPAPKQFRYPAQAVAARDRSSEEKLTRLWQGFGFNRTVSNSLVNERYCYPEATGKTPVQLTNPLSEDMAFMRTTLLPALLEGVRKNLHRRESDVRLFEFGRIFTHNPAAETGADEFLHFAAVATGNTFPRTWITEQKPIDFYDFKGYIEAMLEVMGVRDYSVQRTDTTLFTPGIVIRVNGENAGVGGTHNPDLLEQFGLKEVVFGLEINMDVCDRYIPRVIQYMPPSDYPAVERDLSFVVTGDLEAAELTRTLRETGGTLLTDVTLYDIYTGDPIPEEKKSLTYTLKFLSKERTLTEKEVDTFIEEILQAAARRHDAYLREQ